MSIFVPDPLILEELTALRVVAAVPPWRHPQEAIDRAKASLERYARSQYDEIKIYSKKYMGRVYFHVSGMQQMIDWQPAKAPPRNSHGGEVRARGIDSMARRGVCFKK
jgi:hypothetical protein